MTGTDSAPVSGPDATQDATEGNADGCNPNGDKEVMSIAGRKVNPLVVGSSPTPVIGEAQAEASDSPSLDQDLDGFPLFLGTMTLLRGRRLIDHGCEHVREPLAGITRAGRRFRHLREAELRIGKRQPSLSLFGRGQKRVLLDPVPDLHAASLQQLELPVERPQTDSQVGQDRVASAQDSRPGTTQADAAVPRI